MPKQLMTYKDFRGGLNVDTIPDNLADNELSIAQNIVLSERGGFSKRKGIVPLNGTSYDKQVEQVFEWLRKNGTAQLMSVINDDLNRVTEDGTLTKVIDLTVSTRNVFQFSFQDILFFGDGTECYFYDGTTASKIQLVSPSTAPTITGSGSGSINGTYKAKVIFYNSANIESEASPEATATITSAAQIDWASVPTGPTGTAGRKLYRTKAGGSAFYLVAAIADNTTTIYTDAKLDTDLDIAFVQSDLAPIKRCRFAANHAKSYRFFYAGDSSDKIALYYSEPNEPGKVKPISKLYPTHMLGEITGLKEFGDTIIVFFKNGARIARGIDPEIDMTWEELPIKQGAESNESIILTPNSLTYLGNGGLYAISPGIIGVDSAIVPGDNIVTNLSENKVNSIIRSIKTSKYSCGVYDSFNDILLLAYNDVDGTTRNNKVLVLDWELKSFVTWTGWNVNSWCLRANGDLVFASNNYIYKAHQEYSDNGTAISALVETKAYDLGYPMNRKINFKAFVSAKPGGLSSSSFVLTIKSENDSVFFPSAGLTKSFIWGQAWGLPWSNEDIIIKEFKAKIKGTRFKVRYQNNINNESMTIYSNAFEFKARKPRGERVDEEDGLSI